MFVCVSEQELHFFHVVLELSLVDLMVCSWESGLGDVTCAISMLETVSFFTSVTLNSPHISCIVRIVEHFIVFLNNQMGFK